MKKLLILIIFFVGNGYTSLTFATKTYVAVGSAPIIDGALNLAKNRAIKDALNQAALQYKAHIESTATTISNVLIIESSRVNGVGTVEQMKVLDEWQQDGIIHVRIRAQIDDEQQRSPSPAARYRKKVAFLQFDILQRQHVQDLPNIEKDLPREFIRRLENTGSIIGVDATQYLVSALDQEYQHNSAKIYSDIATKTGTQIVVSGILRDLSHEQGLLNFFGKKRRFEMEIFIHDGISGVRIARHRSSELVKHGEIFEKNMPLFSNTHFYASRYGKMINQIIDSQIRMVLEDLDELPFSARIVHVDGKEVFFDAGASSLVSVGDVLMAYRLNPDPLIGASSNQYLGYLETPIATMAIQQVQPLFAIGKLEINTTKLSPGDIIRFGR